MRALQELRLWIAENLQKRLSVEQLAGHVAMSVRNFERVFTREVGITPAHYVLHVRVEAVRRELQQTGKGFKQVAAATGFGSADSMRRAFLRLLGITPQTYRAQLSARKRTATPRQAQNQLAGVSDHGRDIAPQSSRRSTPGLVVLNIVIVIDLLEGISNRWLYVRSGRRPFSHGRITSNREVTETASRRTEEMERR